MQESHHQEQQKGRDKFSKKKKMASPHFHRSPLDGRAPFVLDEAPDSPVRLPDELEQRGPVVPPELLQLGRRRVLAAAQLQRHLHAAVPDVVVVLHPAGQRVPGGAVGGAVQEGGGAGLAGLAQVHPTQKT